MDKYGYRCGIKVSGVGRERDRAARSCIGGGGSDGGSGGGIGGR